MTLVSAHALPGVGADRNICRHVHIFRFPCTHTHVSPCQLKELRFNTQLYTQILVSTVILHRKQTEHLGAKRPGLGQERLQMSLAETEEALRRKRSDGDVSKVTDQLEGLPMTHEEAIKYTAMILK